MPPLARYIACDDPGAASSVGSGPLDSSWGCLGLHDGFIEAVQSLPDTLKTPKVRDTLTDTMPCAGRLYMRLAQEYLG
eukprot:COSAG05_NODE_297_length_11939_cov_17.362753_12_plen_78_part_00